MKKKFVPNSCDTVASVSYLNLLMSKYLFTCRRSNTSLSFSPSVTVSGLMQHGGLPLAISIHWFYKSSVIASSTKCLFLKLDLLLLA